MNSLEKLAAYLADFQAAPPSSEPLELTLRTLLMTAGPQLAQLLPADPHDFDDMLAHGAAALLRLRSDDAQAIAMVPGDEVDQLELNGDQAAALPETAAE